MLKSINNSPEEVKERLWWKGEGFTEKEGFEPGVKD